MKTEILITCDNIIEANFIQNRLENEGINSFLTNENFSHLMPLYYNIMGSGVQVIIDAKDIIKAREIISNKLSPENKDIICPYCHSKNIGLGIGKNKILKIFNMIIAVLMIIPLGNLKPRYYCKDCKNEIR
jgi:uncharacterized protein YlaI